MSIFRKTKQVFTDFRQVRILDRLTRQKKNNKVYLGEDFKDSNGQKHSIVMHYTYLGYLEEIVFTHYGKNYIRKEQLIIS